MGTLDVRAVAQGLLDVVYPQLDEETQEFVDFDVEESDWQAVVSSLRHAARVLNIELPEDLAE